MNDPHADAVLLTHLEPDETVHAVARATDAVLAVSDRRVVVADPDRLLLSLRIEALRRVQFDIEKARPATLVIVPESPNDEPQVLTVPPHRLREVATLLAIIGERLSDMAIDRATSA